MGDIEIFFGNLISPFVCQMKTYLFSLMIQSRAKSLLGLDPFIRNTVFFPILYKTGPCLDKIKSNIIFSALIIQKLYPLIMTGAGSVIIFPSAQHLFNLALRQILSEERS